MGEDTIHGCEYQEAGIIEVHVKGWLPQNSKRKSLLCKKKCEKGEEVNRKAGLWLQFFSVKGEATSFSKSEGVREFGVGV